MEKININLKKIDVIIDDQTTLPVEKFHSILDLLRTCQTNLIQPNDKELLKSHTGFKKYLFFAETDSTKQINALTEDFTGLIESVKNLEVQRKKYTI